MEDYYIDNAGKQIYQPKTSAVNPVVLYADDPYANSAFEKMRLNLTLEEIYNLSVYGQVKVDVIEKNQTYLTRAEIAALYEMTYEERYGAYIALVYAAETYGAADTGANETTTTAETTPVETTTEIVTTTVPETTVADKTDISYDKTDISYDKTDIVTTMADKTDIVTTYGDKTDISTYPEKTDIVISYDNTAPAVTGTAAATTTSVTTTTENTTTTLPPETTAATTTSDRFDVQGEIVTEATKEPK